jgi:hypothetical protein
VLELVLVEHVGTEQQLAGGAVESVEWVAQVAKITMTCTQ